MPAHCFNAPEFADIIIDADYDTDRFQLSGFDVFEADQAKVGRPLTHAIKAGRADNLPPIMMEMRRKPKKICSEITRWYLANILFI